MNRKRSVIVTGSSSGIGKAISDLLLEQGHHVIGVSRQPERQASHEQYTAFAFDLKNIAEMPQGLQAAEFINKIRIPGKNQIDYERAEMFIGGGVKLTGKETVDELIEMFLNSMKSYKSPFKAAKGGLAKILEV